jgi:hypothetical protein
MGEIMDNTSVLECLRLHQKMSFLAIKIQKQD